MFLNLHPYYPCPGHYYLIETANDAQLGSHLLNLLCKVIGRQPNVTLRINAPLGPRMVSEEPS